MWELRRERLLLTVQGSTSSRAGADALLGRLPFVPGSGATAATRARATDQQTPAA